MRKLWYCFFYGLCVFTIVFSLYWIAVSPAPSAPPASSGGDGAESPAVRADLPLSGIEEADGYYLCDEGGRLAVYRCSADGIVRERLELTDIYVNLLPERDALRIKAGYRVWSRQELDSLLEDLGG